MCWMSVKSNTISYVGGKAQSMKLLGLMRRLEDLIVNLVLARGAGENYHLPPLLYIDDPRGQGGSLSP